MVNRRYSLFGSYGLWLTTSIICLLLVSCLEEEPVELDFFRVDTAGVNKDLGAFGTVALNGNLEALPNTVVEDYGFYLANNRSALDCGLSATMTPRSLGSRFGGGIFRDTLSISTNQWYYYQAFARIGERLVCSSVDSFLLGVDLRVTQLDEVRRNDSISYRLEADIDARIDEFSIGYYLLQGMGSSYDTIYTELFGSRVSVDFTVFFPAFNTRYKILPFVRGDQVYTGAAMDVLVTDGWRRIGNFPVPLKEAVTVPFGDDIFVFGGQNIELNPSGGTVFYLPNPAGADPEDWVWQNISDQIPSESDISRQITEGIGFADADNIYLGFGYAPFDNFLGLVKGVDPTTFGETEYATLLGFRVNAIAFVEDEFVYYGLGSDPAATAQKDFYRTSLGFAPFFNPDDTLVSPPRRDIGVDGPPQGRNGAIAVRYGDAITGKWLIGVGTNGPLYFNDFYAFSPPNEENPMGFWEFAGELNGAGRTESSAFTINGRAFVGFGEDFNRRYLNDLWEYKPDNAIQNRWVRRQSLPNLGPLAPIAFTTEELACVCGGENRINASGTDTAELSSVCYVYYPSQFD